MDKHLLTLELDKVINKVNEKVRLNSNLILFDSLNLMSDVELIKHSLLEVDEATVLIERFGIFPLYFFSNIILILKLIQKGRIISTEDLVEIGKLLDTIKANIVYLKQLDGYDINCVYYRSNIEKMIYPMELNKRIKEIITPYGEIKDDASVNLKVIRKSIKDTQKNIQTKLQEILAKQSAKLTQSIISIRNDRYVIPVKVDQKNNVAGVVHDESASGETVFIEPLAVHELNNKLNKLYEDEKKEIQSILKIISSEIDISSEILINNLAIISHLDIVFAKAEYSLIINGNVVNINDDGILDLVNARHPLLNVEKVVPNSVKIGKDYKGIIITGPNTGGKTVLLKTVGLISLMVRLGLLVPCDKTSNIMIFDNVFADIGDEQSIDQNLSTFSSHMKNVINIIDEVTNNSLVLLDELGSGTDPAEGSSLAIAIFDYLINKQCLVIATSHYSELKVHAFNSNNIINASVEFNVETLKPTYKLLLGVPGLSNALKITRILGLPEEIIKSAENYVYQKNDNLDIVLEKLIKQSHELDYKLSESNALRRGFENKIKELDSEKQKLIIDKNDIMKKAEEDAREIIKNSSSKIDKILKELNELKNRDIKPHEISEIKHDIKTLKEEAKVELDSIPTNEDFDLHQSVFVESFGAYGIIIKQNKNNKFDVQIGNATVTVDKKHLKLAKVENIIPKKTTTNISVKKDISMVLDLRGQRFEEAKINLDKFIDDAILANFKQVNIIHGFGTGVIRELVINQLKISKDVESYRYGGANEGGQGITVVTLKSI